MAGTKERATGRRTARCVRWLCCLGVLLPAGCGRSESSAQELAKGELVENDGEVTWNVPTKDRLGVRMPGAATPGGMGGMPGMEGGDVAPAVDPSKPSPIAWSTPAGWTEVAPTSMRLANFQAGDPGVQCYVTVLGGDGGGVLGNVNRWRGQLDQAPVDPAAIDALPRVPQLGVDAVLIEIVGATDAMLATISLHGSSSIFVKMLGPKELVLAEKDRFVAFCGGLKFQG